jgi:uncharacterized protein YdaU (DUF1376 family)
MARAHFMQFYWGDYFADTGHLTTEQHGAYMLLLGRMWMAGGTLPTAPDKLARLTGCTPSRWARIAPDVLAFFVISGDQMTHERLMLELEKAVKKSNQLALSGALGGKAKSLKNNNAPLANAKAPLKHYIESESKIKNKRFGNEEFRKAAAASQGEDWARSWLDPCDWRDDPPAVICRTGLAVDRIRRDLARVLPDWPRIEIIKKGVDTP